MSDQQDFPTNLGGLSDEDRQIERLLASMTPRESRVSLDRMLYLAGEASALASNSSGRRRATRWIWPTSTVCAACAGLMIGIILPARNPIAGNPVAVEQRGVPGLSTSTAGGTGSPKSPQVANAAPADQQAGFSADSIDRRMAVDLHAMVAKGFPLLALRDRMLANHGDDTALAQADPSTRSDNLAADIERPLGARALFERWIEDEGPTAH